MRIVKLKSIQTNSGFLEHCKVDFAPRLTCIIGARGTCKSTLVESIRFAFDFGVDRVKELTSPKGMITETLGAGSVRCVIEVEEDGGRAEYTVDREIGSPPRVLRNGSPELLADDVLHEIEIYSQGALQQIAASDEPQDRLQLIDRFNPTRIRHIKGGIRKRVGELQELGDRLRAARATIEKCTLDLKDLHQFRAELGRVASSRPQLPPTLEEQHVLYGQRQRVLETLGEVRDVQDKAAADLAVAIANRDNLAFLRAQLDGATVLDVDGPLELIDRLDDSIRSLERSREAITSVPVGQTFRDLSSQYEKESETYHRLRQQQQAVNESLKREEAVRRRVVALEKVERQLKEVESESHQLIRRRKMARAELATMRNEIFEMRVREADKINQEFGEVILLTLKRASHSRPYISRLTELLAGSRIRTQGNIAEELATNLSPDELLEIVEGGEAERLANLLSRDVGQVMRVISYLRDHQDLYDLEGDLFDDSLDITMFDRGQPKAMEQLSAGQRATALLPLILRSSGCPLVVDQPEDDLDNSFVFRMLVNNILRLKTERQLIFVTHNANIPVLGDAEEIVVMRMERPTKAAPPAVGSVEDRKGDILDLLEGGKEAFERREQRYGSLLG